MLKFSKANNKIQALSDILPQYAPKKSMIYSLDLLSGWSCPYAKDCLSKVYDINGKKKLVDGKHTQFRCFSASQEVVFPAAYDNRKYNFDLLKSTPKEEYAALIHTSLPENVGIVRIHVAGDFFNSDYMLSWAIVAEQNPNVLFYAYTKSLTYWIKHREYFKTIKNFVLTASRGGTNDSMINAYRLRSAIVVNHPSDTKLEIDHDDSHAADPSKKRKNFALLIHGIQPAGSEAAKAISKLKTEGVKYAYGKK